MVDALPEALPDEVNTALMELYKSLRCEKTLTNLELSGKNMRFFISDKGLKAPRQSAGEAAK